MVMEAPPSPQCVGREFVRQYYTLLNKAPTHLHRFYNNQSSFVHGGLEAPNRETSPMIGQKQIHQKIQQLNFQDCHAKITQVDSQATLGNGVVVQVTGELSNAGQPMRRFTQTFVLAAQSPKKYYVHNDIFRYQDEIYTDEECDPDSGRSEAEEEQIGGQTGMPVVVNQEAPQPQQPIMQQQQQPPITPAAFFSGAAVNAAPPMQPAPNMPVPPHHPPHVPPTVITATPPVPTVNGSVHPEDVLPPVMPGSVAQAHLAAQTIQSPHNALGLGQPAMQNVTAQQPALPNASPTTLPQQQHPPQPQQPTPQQQPVPTPEEPPKMDMQQPQQPEPEVTVDESTAWCDDKPLESDQQPIAPEEPPQEPVVSNEPKTYATLLKSGGGTTGSSFTSSASTPSQPTNKMSTSPPPTNRLDQSREQNSMSTLNATAPPLGQRNPMNRGPRPMNNSGPRNNMPRQDSRGMNRTNFNDDNDTHQLFLGNLPHSATEEELRELFSQFGTIVELRILSKTGTNKSGMQGNSVRAPPNYGFITYEDQQAVQNCLMAKPLFFPPNSDNPVKLNIEEKKARMRNPMEGGRINNIGGGGGGGGGGPDQQGPGGRSNNSMSRLSSGSGPGGGGGGMIRSGPGGGGMGGGGGGGGGHRGIIRSGGNFQRGSNDNRGHNMNRGSGANNYNNRR